MFVAQLLALQVGCVLSAVGVAPARQPDQFGGYSSSQIVVRLKREAFERPALRNRIAALGRQSDPRAELGAPLRAAARNWRVLGMRPAYAGAFAHPDRAASHGLDRTYIIEVPAGTDTETMAAAFARFSDDIEVATVDTIGGVADLFPNDPSFGVQYALHNTGQTVQGLAGTADADIDAPQAWGIHTGDFGSVTIAIIDSGVDSHFEYGVNAAPYPNGRIVEGRNTNNPFTPTLTTDGCQHGTHVAGIAAAGAGSASELSSRSARSTRFPSPMPVTWLS